MLNFKKIKLKQLFVAMVSIAVVVASTAYVIAANTTYNLKVDGWEPNVAKNNTIGITAEEVYATLYLNRNTSYQPLNSNGTATTVESEYTYTLVISGYGGTMDDFLTDNPAWNMYINEDYYVGYTDGENQGERLFVTYNNVDTSGGTITSSTSGSLIKTSQITDVIVEDVVNVGAYAFKNMTGVTSISLDSGVTSLGIGFMEGCVNLVSAVIEGTTFMSDSVGIYSTSAEGNVILVAAFPSVEQVNLSNSLYVDVYEGSDVVQTIYEVNEIADYAFASCIYLTRLDIPDTVTKIGEKILISASTFVSSPDPLADGGTPIGGIQNLDYIIMHGTVSRTIDKTAFMYATNAKIFVTGDYLTAADKADYFGSYEWMKYVGSTTEIASADVTKKCLSYTTDSNIEIYQTSLTAGSLSLKEINGINYVVAKSYYTGSAEYDGYISLDIKNSTLMTVYDELSGKGVDDPIKFVDTETTANKLITFTMISASSGKGVAVSEDVVNLFSYEGFHSISVQNTLCYYDENGVYENESSIDIVLDSTAPSGSINVIEDVVNNVYTISVENIHDSPTQYASGIYGFRVWDVSTGTKKAVGLDNVVYTDTTTKSVILNTSATLIDETAILSTDENYLIYKVQGDSTTFQIAGIYTGTYVIELIDNVGNTSYATIDGTTGYIEVTDHTVNVISTADLYFGTNKISEEIVIKDEYGIEIASSNNNSEDSGISSTIPSPIEISYDASNEQITIENIEDKKIIDFSWGTYAIVSISSNSTTKESDLTVKQLDTVVEGSNYSDSNITVVYLGYVKDPSTALTYMNYYMVLFNGESVTSTSTSNGITTTTTIKEGAKTGTYEFSNLSSSNTLCVDTEYIEILTKPTLSYTISYLNSFSEATVTGFISGTFDYIKMPDDSETTDANFTFSTTENGSYIFKVAFMTPDNSELVQVDYVIDITKIIADNDYTLTMAIANGSSQNLYTISDKITAISLFGDGSTTMQFNTNSSQKVMYNITSSGTNATTSSLDSLSSLANTYVDSFQTEEYIGTGASISYNITVVNESDIESSDGTIKLKDGAITETYIVIVYYNETNPSITISNKSSLESSTFGTTACIISGTTYDYSEIQSVTDTNVLIENGKTYIAITYKLGIAYAGEQNVTMSVSQGGLEMSSDDYEIRWFYITNSNSSTNLAPTTIGTYTGYLLIPIDKITAASSGSTTIAITASGLGETALESVSASVNIYKDDTTKDNDDTSSTFYIKFTPDSGISTDGIVTMSVYSNNRIPTLKYFVTQDVSSVENYLSSIKSYVSGTTTSLASGITLSDYAGSIVLQSSASPYVIIGVAIDSLGNYTISSSGEITYYPSTSSSGGVELESGIQAYTYKSTIGTYYIVNGSVSMTSGSISTFDIGIAQ